MAFIYNLSDTWNDAATTWNGIKLAVTNTGSSASSNLLNLTVTGATTASFVVDKSGNLALNGTVNKITFTAPATAATLTLADNSTFITSGAYSSTFTFSGTTTLTFPTSGTVTALGNTTTGSGAIVLASSPTLISPALGTPSSGTLTNCTGLLISGISATGTPSSTTYLRGDGTWSTVSGGGGGSGTVTSVSQTFTGGLISVSGSPITTSGTLALTVAGTSGGVPYFSSSSTWASSSALTANALVIGGGAGAAPSTTATGTGILTFLGTPSSANLAAAITDETGSGSLVFSTAPTFGTDITVGTASSSTGIVNLKGTTSGTVGVSVADAAGTWTLKLPTTAGTNGYVLSTDGTGVTSWIATSGGGGTVTSVSQTFTGGLISVSGSPITGSGTLALTVAGTSGGIPYFSSASTWATSAALTANAIVIGGGAGAAPSTITTGTGVVTALGVNTGSAGAFVVNGGALGTPSSGTLTNCTSVPVNQATGVLPVANGGTNASSAGITAFNNITGYTATGATGTTSTNLVFSTSPTLTTPTLGVASATSINKVAITAPATSATLTIADGKTLTANNTITLAATNDSQTYTLPAATCNIGYLEVPQNSQSAAYTAVLADSGKQIFHPSTDNNARTFTIPANGSVAYPVGTVLTFVNMANTVTIAITTDTMYLAGTGTTGSRTLAAYGVATAIKMTSTTWLISGTGLT
jgi:hypothetical protein